MTFIPDKPIVIYFDLEEANKKFAYHIGHHYDHLVEEIICYHIPYYEKIYKLKHIQNRINGVTKKKTK